MLHPSSREENLQKPSEIPIITCYSTERLDASYRLKKKEEKRLRHV